MSTFSDYYFSEVMHILKENKAIYTAYNLTLSLYQALGRNHLRNDAHCLVGFRALAHVVTTFP
jgi:hypothetical protein